MCLHQDVIAGWSRSKSSPLKLPSTQHPCTSVRSSLWLEGKTSKCTSLTTRREKKLVGLGFGLGFWFYSLISSCLFIFSGFSLFRGTCCVDIVDLCGHLSGSLVVVGLFLFCFFILHLSIWLTQSQKFCCLLRDKCAATRAAAPYNIER